MNRVLIFFALAVACIVVVDSMPRYRAAELFELYPELYEAVYGPALNNVKRRLHGGPLPVATRLAGGFGNKIEGDRNQAPDFKGMRFGRK
ncbi:unnamed protein product [Dimorphilus gyrociliatus]|uniref:Uncharacterized protein n=1 Tax=Dimorphilus gyrociliatus TaxID=2664684 RepID=A0A7I8W4B5_9ANNE|nr:unnamed protein product [Dimorphilus gyrociliatus]